MNSTILNALLLIIGIIAFLICIKAVYRDYLKTKTLPIIKFIGALVGLFLIVGGGLTLVGNNGLNKPAKKAIDYNNLKTMADLEAYVIQNAQEKCEVWQRACNYTNETKRWQEQLFVDGWVDNFQMIVLLQVVQNNDLPNSFLEPAKEVFLKKMRECGWSANRSNWPGNH